MRPRSAATLPDSTASTGLLCLSVGARQHCGRSDIEVDHVATTTHIPPSVRDIYTIVANHSSKKYQFVKKHNAFCK